MLKLNGISMSLAQWEALARMPMYAGYWLEWRAIAPRFKTVKKMLGAGVIEERYDAGLYRMSDAGKTAWAAYKKWEQGLPRKATP